MDVRNDNGKLVCRVYEASKVVEIVIKGCCTCVRFLDNGQVQIQNLTINK